VKTIIKHLRLLPAVIATAGMLLAVKSVGFAVEARAQDNATQPAAAAQAPAQADPAEDNSENASAAEVDVLTSLSKRRAELDAREQDLAMRANLIAAAEQRVDGKIDNLKQLQTQIQQLLGQRDEAAQKQLDGLVKTYSSMKPHDAARIFDALNETVLLAVASEMKPDVLGSILAAMQPDAAQKLTVKLANRLNLPEQTAMAAPAQTAAVTPPAPANVSAATPTPAATPNPAAPKTGG
jgi:flagellar motility protein MotE (MotC chaperone)